MPGITKRHIKHLLGGLPLTAEIFWQMERSGKAPTKSFSLHRLEKDLPSWIAEAQSAQKRHLVSNSDRKRVFIFATLRQWIQQGTLLGITLSGMGHNVILGYLPYSDWRHPIDRFDLRRQRGIGVGRILPDLIGVRCQVHLALIIAVEDAGAEDGDIVGRDGKGWRAGANDLVSQVDGHISFVGVDGSNLNSRVIVTRLVA